MLRTFLFVIAVLLTAACDDGGGSSGDGGDCPALGCALSCDDGLRRGPDGCEICECNPTPGTSCMDDGDCVLAVDHEDCCSCRGAYAASSIEGHSCIAEVSEPTPPGCVRESCDGAACRCAYPLRAACESGACVALDDCPTGEMEMDGVCVPAP